MNTLISPNEVVALAFSPEEVYNNAVITELDVATAEERYLRPLLGQALYDKFLEGNYQSLKDEFVAPVVAVWTRYLVEPLLASRCDACSFAEATAASNEALAERCRQLRLRARTLSRGLTHHLNSRVADYPEYNPDENHLNRCSIDGNIVQIR